MKLDEGRGHWALVTGASSGIGAVFCERLAAAGMNLVLVARREAELRSLASRLEARHAVQTLVVVSDLSVRAAAAEVKDATTERGLRIRLLINNAGSDPWGSFEKSSADTYEGLVQLLAATPIALCRHFLEDLASHSSSAIVNVSSPAALQPVAYKAVYASAKACIHNFSLALYGEWQARGICVQTLMPGPTATEIDAKGGAYASGLGEERRPPTEVVDACLSQLGKDVPIVTTQKRVGLQRAFAGLAPAKILVREVRKMFVPPPGR